MRRDHDETKLPGRIALRAVATVSCGRLCDQNPRLREPPCTHLQALRGSDVGAVDATTACKAGQGKVRPIWWALI